MSRHLFEQLKHFLTADDTQADKYGAKAIANLVDDLCGDIVGMSAELGSIQTDVSSIYTDVGGIHVDTVAMSTDLVAIAAAAADIQDNQLPATTTEAAGIHEDTTAGVLSWASTQTDVAATHSEATSLQRGRTNLGGKLKVLHLGTSSGTVASAMGTTNGARIRKILVSYNKPNAANEFRITLAGTIMAQFWIPTNHATSPFWIDLGEFYWTSNTANPTFQIARTNGGNEIQMTIYYEDLAEDDSGYPTS